MSIEELDAELRPHGWHAWQSDGTRAWQRGRYAALPAPLRYETRYYACTAGTTEWADTVGGLRDKVTQVIKVRALAAETARDAKKVPA